MCQKKKKNLGYDQNEVIVNLLLYITQKDSPSMDVKILEKLRENVRSYLDVKI